MRSHPTASASLLRSAGVLLSLSSLAAPALAAAPAQSTGARPGSAAVAQVESFMLKPGSNVGPATKVTPTNCVTAPDGSITCDTKIENSPGDTPAKPQYQPFKN